LRNRDDFLDGFRGIAIAAVLLAHCMRFNANTPALDWADAFFASGWMGVDLFFVLSGYLITRILLCSRGSQRYFTNFYMRRVLRILPAYYFYLLLVFVATPAAGWIDPALRYAEEFVPLAFFLQNFSISLQRRWFQMPGLDHLWSIAVEEQFYVVWPLLVAACPPRLLARCCLAIILVAWVTKLALTAAGAWAFSIYVLPFTRMDALAAGALIAALPYATWNADVCRKTAMGVGTAALMLVVLEFLRSRGLAMSAESPAAAYTILTTLVCAALLFAVVRAPQADSLRRLCSIAPLRFLGKYSYGIYLLHYGITQIFKRPLLSTFEERLPEAFGALVAGFSVIAVSILAAIAMFHLLEQPLLNLKRYFEMEQGAPSPLQQRLNMLG
jgi:peptidoglycan/LPS O-acetylase OafA/YrhL